MAETLKTRQVRAETRKEWIGPLTLRDQDDNLITGWQVALVPIGGQVDFDEITALMPDGDEFGIQVGVDSPWPLSRGVRYDIVAVVDESVNSEPLVTIGRIQAT